MRPSSAAWLTSALAQSDVQYRSFVSAARPLEYMKNNNRKRDNNRLTADTSMSGIFLCLQSMRGDITKRMIKFCSPLSFGVYLIHTHPSVWNNLLSNRFSRFANYSSFFCILLVLFSSVAIFSVCIVVDFLRYALFRRLKLT